MKIWLIYGFTLLGAFMAVGYLGYAVSGLQAEEFWKWTALVFGVGFICTVAMLILEVFRP